MKTIPALARPSRPLLVVALALLLAAPAARAAGPGAPREVAAIRAVLDAQVAAWNRGDLDAFMDGYWRSDSLTFYSGGNIAHGWTQARDRYRARYQGEGKEMGTLVFDLHAIEVLSRDAALVKGGWSLRMTTGEPHGLFTLLLRRVPGAGWRVVHDHSSAATP